MPVVEVNRPNRQNRRQRGKSDTVDAEAARAVLAGDATVTPKAGTGPVEALRQLRVARAGAMKARTAAANQLHSLIDTAPERVRAQLRDPTFKQKIAPSGVRGRRARNATRHREWVAVHGVAYDTAGQLLVTAGDNPDRLRHEGSYAALCGSSPVQASSGKLCAWLDQ